jgi:hypothetical protein
MNPTVGVVGCTEWSGKKAEERSRVQGAGCRVQGAGCRVQGAPGVLSMKAEERFREARGRMVQQSQRA